MFLSVQQKVNRCWPSKKEFSTFNHFYKIKIKWINKWIKEHHKAKKSCKIKWEKKTIKIKKLSKKQNDDKTNKWIKMNEWMNILK